MRPVWVEVWVHHKGGHHDNVLGGCPLGMKPFVQSGQRWTNGGPLGRQPGRRCTLLAHLDHKAQKKRCNMKDSATMPPPPLYGSPPLPTVIILPLLTSRYVAFSFLTCPPSSWLLRCITTPKGMEGVSMLTVVAATAHV